MGHVPLPSMASGWLFFLSTALVVLLILLFAISSFLDSFDHSSVVFVSDKEMNKA